MSPIYFGVPVSDAYRRVEDELAGGGCVLVDGGVATELDRIRDAERSLRDEQWGVWALHRAQTEVLDVHRRYVAAGCDVLSTNSWAILEQAETWGEKGPPRAWEDAADAALRLARRAAGEAPGGLGPAVAFCINGDLRGERALGALELLTWRWREQAPDLVFFETLEQLPGERVFDAVGMVAELGVPVWVSMRRGRDGMASRDGSVTPDEDPQALARAAERLQAAGAGALLVNCVPRALVREALTGLAAVSALPVGCLPNLGASHGGAWEPDDELSPERFADEALDWLEAGARIVGGCCGVGPAHIRAVRGVLQRATAWSARGV